MIAFVLAAVVSLAAIVGAGPPDLVIRNVRIVHGDGRVTASGAVAIRGGRLLRVTSGAEAARLRGAREIDGGGRTLLPGLIDAHVRLGEAVLPLLLRYGVTTVRDLHNDPAYVLRLAREDAPALPRVVAAGALLDGPGSAWPGAFVIETRAGAAAAVRRLVGDGAGVVSVGPRLHPALVAAIVQEARARGVAVAAVGGQTNALEAAAAGVGSLEQMTGISDAASVDPDRIRRAHGNAIEGWSASEREWLVLAPARLGPVTRTLVREGVAVVPTLVMREALLKSGDATASGGPMPLPTTARGDPGELLARTPWPRATLRDFSEALVREMQFLAQFAAAGGRIAAGTDAPRQFVVPGASLHHELQLYVAAGLTPAAAIRSATADAAAVLGVADRTGTIDPGKDADLLLVDGDPLKDIRATLRIVLVLRAGRIVYPVR